MKRVSFKVAKVIKDAGYPQNDLSFWYDRNGTIFTIHPKEGTEYYVALSYIEVWFWLWREKDIKLLFYPTYKEDSSYSYIQGLSIPFNKEEYNDPEEAIIAVIDYFIDNDLIK